MEGRETEGMEGIDCDGSVTMVVKRAKCGADGVFVDSICQGEKSCTTAGSITTQGFSRKHRDVTSDCESREAVVVGKGHSKITHRNHTNTAINCTHETTTLTSLALLRHGCLRRLVRRRPGARRHELDLALGVRGRVCPVAIVAPPRRARRIVPGVLSQRQERKLQ